MPTSFKHEGDDCIVIDNQTGRVITEAVTAQTSAMTGPSYTVVRRGLFGRRITKSISADIRIERCPRRVPLEGGDRKIDLRGGYVDVSTHAEVGPAGALWRAWDRIRLSA